MIHYMRALAARLRGLFGDRRADREFDDEIESHLRLLTERYVRQGMTEAEAAWTARRQFGNITLLKEENREMRGIRLINELIQDSQYGLSMLRRSPGFTFIAVLMLALVIGANTAVFSLINAVLLRSLPYYDPQRLVWVTEVWNGSTYCGDADYLHWQADSRAFDNLVLFMPGQVYLTGRGEPERLDSIRTTFNLFPTLGVSPQLGRAFTPEEDRPGSGFLVILSHAFWQRRFGGDPSVIGQSLTLDGRNWTVIGVMPPEFKFIRKADVLMPRALDVVEVLSSQDRGQRKGGNIIGRLKPGVTPEQAQSELETILQRLRQASPEGQVSLRGERAIVTPLGEILVHRLRLGLLALFGVTTIILLIACANLANLLLARASVRKKELAIRAAIGAGRGRLVRQMLTESLLLSVFGGVAGLLLAVLGVKLLAPLIPDNLAYLKEGGISIDGAAFGFTFLTLLLTGVIAGIIPALQASRIVLNEGLKEGGRDTAFSRRIRARRISPSLVIGELALTLALLAGAGLLIKSFLRLLAVEPGYNPENLLTMTIPRYTARYSLAQRNIFVQDLLTRVKSLPGVKVAAVGPLPLIGRRRGSPPPPLEEFLPRSSQCCLDVSPDYFRALGMQLRAGRIFTEQDNENAPLAIVVNETFVRTFHPREVPIGTPHLYDDSGKQGTIVGVAPDVKRYGLEVELQFSEEYHSIFQSARTGDINLLIRTEGDPLQLAPAVRQRIWEINANIPVVDVMSMEQRLAESFATQRFQTLLFSFFAAFALAVTIAGIYGFNSYAVSQRTKEMAHQPARPHIHARRAVAARRGNSLQLRSARINRKRFKSMSFVYEEGVDTGFLEVHNVVLVRRIERFLQFRFDALLDLLQPFDDAVAGARVTLLVSHRLRLSDALFDLLQFRPYELVHDLGRHRHLVELFV